MYYRIIRNDIRRNKAVTLTTMLFVAAAALLVALAAILVVNLVGALDTLMTRAKTPHFMQMHAGELDQDRMAAFVAQNDAIAAFQVLEFLNVDGAQLVFPTRSLAGSMQDNGFAVQGEHFDYLLDLDGNIIQVADGELYVPLTYMQDGTARVGDTVRVAGHTFIVAGPLRDSQMQPMLSSSKRFLVSTNDFAALKPFGNVEYLIEFRLHDMDGLGAFASAYTAAGLEANGPTLTYPLFRLVNGLSDGLMIAVILLLSALVLAIAFLCIRFTLLAKIEDDYREIGVMKAIGLRVGDIKQIYLATYAALAAAGCILGLGLSLVFHDPLLANIRLYMGASANAALAPLLGMISVLLVFLAILMYVQRVLNRFRQISPAEAMRFGGAQEQSSGGKYFRLSVNKLLGVNLFLGLKDVLARKTLYATMLTVLVLAAFMIIVPQNLYHTIAAKSFITYMGVGNSDLRLDLQQTDNISGKAADIVAVMEHDDAIARFGVLTTKTFHARLADGAEQPLLVELGDHTLFPLTYAAGRAPVADDEIALSVLNADDLGLTVGAVLPVLIAGQERALTVCGIYSDVTNGGKTAKAAFTDAGAATMWSVISAELVDPSLVDATVAAYADQFTFAKVTGLEGYITQTYGATIRAIGQAALVAAGVALTLSVLITLLFMRMLVAKDRYAIAVMKAFGFTNADIQAQYLARSVCILSIGIVLGTLLANTLGEALAGAVIGSFGATSFAFVINPWLAYLLSPLLMGVATLGATIAGVWDAGQISIAEHIKE
ncbi:MAG: FtsX-like permease family protein [Candidatus Viridilinea halotolerans]|uniref:FtsX-like permease family protein n=1 Tax=Candidatus Viridilinea halotolerans TaxID=2491704 RepID=A0A426TT52_9CHLR|nr:MAG: FtsX-like permease family protein [Candidatus Viridilinea halotolerans]